MRLDIRLPIGLMFGVLGAMLGVFGLCSQLGLFADPSIYDRSLGINVDIWWGLVLLAFGIAMYVLGRRGTSAVRPADDTAEGRRMEQREQSLENEGRRPRH